MTGAESGQVRTLADLDEDELLRVILPQLPTNDSVLLGPGDDTAVLRCRGELLATTDTMVLGRDWLDAWSTAEDVGRKAVAQNIADIAAMGGVATGLLVTLVATRVTPVSWARSLTSGIARAAAELGVAVIGGDLSSAPDGRMVSVTALGYPPGPVVRRSGALPGDRVAVAGSLGRSAAGLLLLHEHRRHAAPELVTYHLRPRAPYEQGPVAAAAGATSMIDLSDGLVRDLGRVARASSVRVDLHSALLATFAADLAAVGDRALQCVLTGGEEHSLLATFPASVRLPAGWRQIGDVTRGDGVALDGILQHGGGWDHFGG